MSIFDLKNIKKEINDKSEKPLIMLVDDEVEKINVLRQLLETKYQALTGLNGLEALKLIDGNTRTN